MLGLGRMGLAIAKRLASASVTLYVYDPNPAAVLKCAAFGAVAATPASIRRLTFQQVFLCLPNPESVDGWIEIWVKEALTSSATIVDFTTISRTQAITYGTKLGERGLEYIDAPVSGGVSSVARGKLIIIASGSKNAYASVLPTLAKVGEVVYVGRRGNGSQLKAINQVVYLSQNVAMANAVRFAAASGIPRELALSVLLAGAAGHPLIRERVRNARADRGSAFTIARALKDLGLLEVGDGSSVFEGIQALTLGALEAGASLGLGDRDILELCAVDTKWAS